MACKVLQPVVPQRSQGPIKGGWSDNQSWSKKATEGSFLKDGCGCLGRGGIHVIPVGVWGLSAKR